MVIDDDNRNIFALKAVLKAKGFTVVSALSAQEGLDILRNNQGIRLVLMDIMMPEMDGYEAIGLIRSQKEFAGIPVIAVTAQAMVGDREKVLEAGADAYVSKPIDVDRLLKLMEQFK